MDVYLEWPSRGNSSNYALKSIIGNCSNEERQHIHIMNDLNKEKRNLLSMAANSVEVELEVVGWMNCRPIGVK